MSSRSKAATLPALGLLLLALVACEDTRSVAAPAARATASTAFWEQWGDGRAELSGYAVTVNRYGEARQGELVLIYVTEPMDDRVWVKDDRGDVPAEHRVNVLKLNHVLKFETGIYPYSVMTSVFAPVDPRSAERFQPVKLSFSAQEWCGQVFEQILPGAASFRDELHSYFHAEGDREEMVPAPAGTLYEDALWIQLRELDGPFAGGGDWEGKLVPSLWSARRSHTRLAPVAARIHREAADRGGVPVTRFTLERAGARLVVDVERAAPRRILGWTTSDGEVGRLLDTARLPYWQLHGASDGSYREQLGLRGPGPE